MHVQFNVDNNSRVTSVGFSLAFTPPTDSLPYVIDVTEKEKDIIFNDMLAFYLEDNVLTNGELSFLVNAERIDKKRKVALVNEHGYFIDVALMSDGELNEYTITTLPKIERNQTTRWDFEAKQWIYETVPKTREELLEEENAMLKQENQMTAIAMMELTESILGGK